MSRRIDLTGQQFGRLTVTAAVEGCGNIYWCRCECGTELQVRAGNLRSGNSTSCGCKNVQRLRREPIARRHGYTGTPTWNSWSSMIERCSKPAWKYYHGRGITVCDRWLKFENFLADMGERPPGTTLDRIDGNGNYEPANCRWADHQTQLNNRPNFNRRLTFDGRTQTMAEWARELGMGVTTLHERLDMGWSIERALTTSVRGRRFITYQGKTQSVADWARELGLKGATLYNRLNRDKWPIERALRPLD